MPDLTRSAMHIHRMKKTQPKLLTRAVSPNVQCELWGRAAGRCEFAGCNVPLYKSPVTQESLNIAQKAHIHAFSPGGERAVAGDFDGLNDASNLMLLCYACHRKIDQTDGAQRYPAEILKRWKREHEDRVALVTAIGTRRQSQVLLYGASIGKEASFLNADLAHQAMFPARFPATERPLSIGMSWGGRDHDSAYWQTESTNLRRAFEQQVRPAMHGAEHWSVFAFAPMPLLILLGSLLTDKTPADVYQLRREPAQSWRWSDDTLDTEYVISRPTTFEGDPAVVFSLSAKIDHDRLRRVLGEEISIWELSIAQPHNDFLMSTSQLSAFRTTARSLLAEIGRAHGFQKTLRIFPAMPVATAIELGRVRMPKADMPWQVFDHHRVHDGFVPTLTIGEEET